MRENYIMIVNNFCRAVDCIWQVHYGLSINDGDFVCKLKRIGSLKSYSNCTFVDEQGRLKNSYHGINTTTNLIKVIAELEMDKKKLLSHEEK